MQALGSEYHYTSEAAPIVLRSGLSGRQIIGDPEVEAYVEITDVQQDDRGTLVYYTTRWTGLLLDCRDYIAVWTDANTGELLASDTVDVSNISSLDFISGSCTKEVVTRIPTSPDREVQLQLWQQQDNTVEDILNGTAIGYATMSPPFFLDEAASLGAQPSKPIGEQVEETTGALVASVVRPVVTWGAVALGLYVAIKNREAIAEAFS